MLRWPGILGLVFAAGTLYAADFSFVIIKYHLGDWYNQRDAVSRFLVELAARTTISVDTNYVELELDDERVFEHPFLFINGHVPLRWNDREILALRRYLASGGFVFVNDDYGLDESFRKEIARAYPDNPLREIPYSHPVYHCFYEFPRGLPKIHEHDGKPQQAFGLFLDGRLALFYDYQSDIADGWDAEEVHHDPAEKREAAFRMGVNLAVYALTE
jgi:hypothetical protein